MARLLRKFAVDPDKIAVAGMSNGADAALNLGCPSVDVFSRVAALSPLVVKSCLNMEPRKPGVQFFLAAGVGEPQDMIELMLQAAQALRAQGYATKSAMGPAPGRPAPR